MIRRLGIDFDGTLTDCWSVKEEFQAAFTEAFSALSGLPYRFLKELEQEIIKNRQHDQAFGWEKDGHLIVRGGSDPLVLMTAVYQAIDKELAFSLDPGIHYKAYLQAYERVPAPFREEAKDFLEEVAALHNGIVITNSSTDKVAKRLSEIGMGDFPVIGDAKKMIATLDYDRVPFSIQPEGFTRPIIIARGHFGEVLDEQGVDCSIGDLYEFDLALPLELGCRGILLEHQGVAEHERAHIERTENAYMAHDLSHALEIFKQ